jgi:hypothetical protein
LAKVSRRRLVAAFLLLFLVFPARPGLAASLSGELSGEAVAVDPERETLWVKTPEGADLLVKLAPGAAVRRDDRPSALWALRPVAPGFCCEVRLRLGPDGRATLVEGFYPGGEAKVVTVGAGGVTLELLDGGMTTRPLAPGCRVSRAGRWLGAEALRPDQWVYVLFDLEGRVKKVALPG